MIGGIRPTSPDEGDWSTIEITSHTQKWGLTAIEPSRGAAQQSVAVSAYLESEPGARSRRVTAYLD